MRARTTQRSALLAVAVLALAGCGSTIQVSSSSELGGTGQPGGLTGPVDGTTGLSSGDTASATRGAGSADAPGAPARVQNPGSGSTTGGATGSAVAPGAGTRLPAGVTDTEVLIGRVRAVNVGAAQAAYGSNVQPAPTDKYDRAMVNYVNKHGGVAGRKLKLVYYTVDASAGRSTQELEQAECAHWTQDNKVFAVLHGGTDNLRGCLDRKGVPLIYENVFTNSDNETFSRFRSYYEINAINLSRLGDALPRQLAQGGYFTKGAKLGVLTFDQPQYHRAVDRHLRPALARFGHPNPKVAYVAYPDSTDSSANAVSALPGIVLQMRNADVTHMIMFGDERANQLVYFGKAASSQGYHPRYGLTSASGPAVVADQGLMDASDLRGSVVGGWNPVGDIGTRPHTRFGAGYKKCASIMAAGGAAFTDDDNAAVVGLKTCDAFFFLAAALNRTGSQLSLPGFRTAAESLSRFPSALTYQSIVRPSARDGVAMLATSVFDERCTCYRYVGSLRRIR